MAIKDGNHRASRKDTKNCFYCFQNVSDYLTLTWPQIKALYEYCKMPVQAALCCKECYAKKSQQELFDEFFVSVLTIECDNYVNKKPSVIKDDKIFNGFIASLKRMGAAEKAVKLINEKTYLKFTETKP